MGVIGHMRTTVKLKNCSWLEIAARLLHKWGQLSSSSTQLPHPLINTQIPLPVYHPGEALPMEKVCAHPHVLFLVVALWWPMHVMQGILQSELASGYVMSNKTRHVQTNIIN